MKNRQSAMFVDGADLPLFSGTAPSRRETPFLLEESASLEQIGLPARCRPCRDTGVLMGPKGPRPCGCATRT
jgi:hypothetical protein